MYKPRRAKASYTRRYAHAELSTPDRKTYVLAKLFNNGDFLFEITRNGNIERHELPAVQQSNELSDLIAKVEHTFEGDSNDAEHDATVELINHLKERIAARSRVVIVLEGGLVQDVLSNVPMEFARIDYDTDGAEESDLVDIPQTPAGDTAQAYAYTANADVMPERVNELFTAINTADRHN